MCRNNILAGHYQPSSKKADNKSAKVSGNSAFKIGRASCRERV